MQRAMFPACRDGAAGRGRLFNLVNQALTGPIGPIGGQCYEEWIPIGVMQFLTQV